MPELVLKDSEFRKFSRYVYDIAGINLHVGKKELLKARLGKIVRKRNFRSFREYYDQVINDESGYELKILLDAISTNLTYFFREPDHFEFLRTKALPEIINSKVFSRSTVLRLWSAGCSSGEEAYSIAIAVSEALDHMKKWQIEILATDLSTKVLKTASSGIYEKKKVKSIPYQLKRKYFQKGDNSWKGYFRLKKGIREKISFQRLNFMEEFHFDEPFDIIFCRNVMIYFDNPTKEMLVGKFFQHLGIGGYLFIGHAESLTGIKHNLKYIQPSVYQKI
ncbi:MAG: protein-glutamate O-methyltransferase CheR [Deltaproteobacteria bacterium]|nr:protein-glutamate O-methyltransferase CheR [Deltaproteobacteria bacterium]MBW2340073.1 protein-glutamate O-methyltransferase CheR [Deltaproteobacteria bacterium]